MKLKTTFQYLATAGLSLAMSNVLAGNITAINVSTLPNNQKVVKIQFDSGTIRPSGFITNTPARIALDFPGTGVKLPQPVLQYNDPLLSQIAAAQNADKTRILLNLNKPGQYNAELHGNEVWVYVNEANGTVAAPATSQIQETVVTRTRVAPPTTPDTRGSNTANVGIDFHKGSGNSGVVEIDTAGYNGNVDVKRSSTGLVITLKGNLLPTSAQRTLDARDFSTPVQSIALRRIGNDTQITVRNQGSWDYKSQQLGGRHIFTFTRQTNVAESGLNRNQNRTFSGKRVTLDFQDVDVRTILQILAKESGMNIVASDSVTGKMTLSLKDVPWDQALDLVMQAQNLDSRRQGNIINIAPRQELLEKDRAALQAQKQIEDLGPLVQRTFQLRYKDVSEFRKILNINENGSSNGNNNNSLLSSRGSAVIDPATNTLIIKDNPAVIKQFESLIEQLDVATRQVMIEARIVEATEGFSRKLGVQFGTTGGYTTNSGNGNTTFSPNVNLPATDATSSLSIVKALNSGTLNLTLNAMQAENQGKIISSPRVLTQDHREAVIKAGTEVPYQEASSSGATSVSFKEAVLSLAVTPQITPDGNIIMDIKINDDNVDWTCGGVSTQISVNGTPCLATKTLTTRAMVQDGGTVILGGIYKEDNSTTESKVPLLGDIPVVGRLFRSTSRSNAKNELLIFITPRIMGSEGSNLRY